MSFFFGSNQDRKIPEVNEAPTISKTGDSQVTLTFSVNEKCGVYIYRGDSLVSTQTLLPDVSTNVVINSIPDGVHQFYYFLRDISFNQTDTAIHGSAITIDTTGAVLTLNSYNGSTSPIYIEKFASSYSDPGVSAIDAVDGDISSSVTNTWVGSTLDSDLTGTYTLRYTVSDSGGFSNTIDRSYIVRDTVDPQVTIDSITASESEVTLSFSSLTEPDVTCNIYQDSARSNLLVSFVQASNTGSFSNTFTESGGAGSYTYYITLVDQSGNDTDFTTDSVTISSTGDSSSLSTVSLNTDLASGSGDGMASAVVSEDGLTVVIGAWKYNNYSGRLRVYTYSTGSWTNTYNINGSGSNSYLGNKLAANADCTKLFTRENDGSNKLSVFSFSNGSWSRSFQSTLGPISIPYGVSSSTSGDVFMVGQHNTYSNKGTIQIHSWNGSTYTSDFSYVPSDNLTHQIGLDCSLNGAGDIAVTGASGTNKVFVFTNGGSGWAFTHSINGPSSSQFFGTSVGLNTLGNLLVVSDRGYNSNDGRVYVYSGSNTSWTLGSTVDSEVTGETFGSVVVMNGEGTRIIVSANGNDETGTNSGRGYLVDIDDVSGWSVTQDLGGEGTDVNALGYKLFDISGDGNTIVALETNNDESSSNAGRGYIYTADI